MKVIACILMVTVMILIPSTAYDQNSDEQLYCNECMRPITEQDVAYENDIWLICNDCADKYCYCPTCGELCPVYYVQEYEEDQD